MSRDGWVDVPVEIDFVLLDLADFLLPAQYLQSQQFGTVEFGIGEGLSRL